MYKNKNLKDSPILFEINESFNSIEVSEADIEKGFAGLNPHHCPVQDNFHLLIIITCKDSIKHRLEVALNLSLSLGIVTSSWKCHTFLRSIKVVKKQILIITDLELEITSFSSCLIF